MNANRTTPQDFLDQAHAWAANLKDDTVSLASLQYLGLNKIITSEVKLEDKPTGGTMNDRARSQLNETLGMPGHNWPQSVACPDDLYRIMLDWKLSHLPRSQRFDRVMLRKRRDGNGGTVRAILSDQYTPLDNLDLIQSVTDAMETNNLLDGVQVFRPSLGDQLTAYYLLPGVQFDTDTPGHSADGGGSGGLHPAIYLSNDETGGGSVRITGAVFRSYCENGAIFGWKANMTDRIIHRWNNRRLLAIKAAESISIALNLAETGALRYIEMQATRIEAANLSKIVTGWAEKYGLKAHAED